MFRELQTFIAVCRAGTFTGAALNQGMTQSAVSDHIRRLEDFAGERLFHRTGRSATLNKAGERMLPLAQEAMGLMDRIRMERSPGTLRGNLRVGTVTSLHNSLVARAMLAFRRLHPEVSVRLLRQEETMLQRVEREELDLGVLVYGDDTIPRTLALRPLLRLPFVLIAPIGLQAPGWRDAVSALPLLRYDQSSASGREVDAFLRSQGITVAESLWINYLDTIQCLVAEGLGVAFVPRTPLGHLRPRIRVMPLGTDTFHRRVGILRRADAPNGSVLADAPHGALLVDAFERTLMQEAVVERYALPPEGAPPERLRSR